jgi:hypothetical protein
MFLNPKQRCKTPEAAERPFPDSQRLPFRISSIAFYWNWNIGWALREWEGR